MKKIAFYIALLTLPVACDEVTGDAPVAFREGVNSEFESLEHVGKILGNCITIERPVTITLVEADKYADGTQSFSLLLESVARVPDVACILAVLEGNQ